MYNQQNYPYGQAMYYNPQNYGYEPTNEVRDIEQEDYRPDDAEDAPKRHRYRLHLLLRHNQAI
ncbi:TPA: hypothetical protein QCN45_005898 [Bacillus cereus]|nr:hypothetical protein [Bacillus cereus]HDR3347956.1 hypothetical protein [Bacillus cereus]